MLGKTRRLKLLAPHNPVKNDVPWVVGQLDFVAAIPHLQDRQLAASQPVRDRFRLYVEKTLKFLP